MRNNEAQEISDFGEIRMIDEPKLGEVCEHGSLKRSCLICELQKTNEALLKENDAFASDLAIERGAYLAMEKELVELRNRMEKLEAVALAAEPLVGIAESYAMQTYDRSGTTRRVIEAFNEALAALDHIGETNDMVEEKQK